MILEASYDLLHISDANCSSSWALEAISAGKIEVNGVFEVNPFLVGEEITEGAVPVRNLSLG